MPDRAGASRSRSTWQPGQLSGAGLGAGLYFILVQLGSTQCNDHERSTQEERIVLLGGRSDGLRLCLSGFTRNPVDNGLRVLRV
jgi:hypothetical protein